MVELGQELRLRHRSRVAATSPFMADGLLHNGDGDSRLGRLRSMIRLRGPCRSCQSLPTVIAPPSSIACGLVSCGKLLGRTGRAFMSIPCVPGLKPEHFVYEAGLTTTTYFWGSRLRADAQRWWTIKSMEPSVFAPSVGRACLSQQPRL